MDAIFACDVMRWMWCMRCDAIDVMRCYVMDPYVMDAMWFDGCDAIDVMQRMWCDAMLWIHMQWMWCDVIDAMLCYGSITSHSSHRNACIHRIVSHHITFITSHPYHHITFIAVIITPLTLLVNLLICHVHFYNIFCIFYVIWRKGIIILRFWL